MHDNIEKVSSQTPDLALERQRQLRELFPEAWSETGLDFAKLRTLLGDLSDDNPERYRFGWAGKREAIQLLQTRSHATLAPDAKASVDFDATRNWFIEGDNLEVLKLLYKPLFGRVKMIYIDPPYNTGNDFIYPDNFADPLQNYLIQTGQKDENGDLQNTAPDTAGRVHSSWLSMLYPRLSLARSLLRDDGVIFVSIDDNEVHHLRLLMNEVFGEENFLAHIIWKKRSGPPNDKIIGSVHEHILVFCRNQLGAELSLLPRTEESMARYSNPDNDPRGDWAPGDISANAKGGRFVASLYYEIVNPETNQAHLPPEGACWRFNKTRVESLIQDKRIYFGNDGSGRPKVKRFATEVRDGLTAPTIWDNVGTNTTARSEINSIFGSNSVFETPKPTSLVKQMLAIASGGDDIILDFFAGSGTTAQAVLELNREDGGNRRFVLVQLPEPTGNDQFPTIADIATSRITRVIERMKETGAGLTPSSNRRSSSKAHRLEEGVSPAPVSSNLSLLDEGLEEGVSPAVNEDLGFKAWKLAPSHFRRMQPVEVGNTEAYLTQLELMNDALLPGSDAHSVIYEIALREGFGLNCDIAPVADLTGVKVWRVTDTERDQRFFISLDETLELESLRPLKLTQDDLFICRSVALDDDTAANLALQCRLKMI